MIDPDKYDLVRLIQRYQPLTTNGGYFRGVENDSLVVDPVANRWYHNSAGKSGDVFDWIMYQHDCDFRTALQILKDVPQMGNPAMYTRAKSYTRLSWEVAELHHKRLSKQGRGWWHQRGVNNHSIDRYLLGEYSCWYTIPIPTYDGLSVANYKLRAAHDGITPRYRQYAKNLEAVVYGDVPTVQSSDTVILVAGEIKRIVLQQHTDIPVITSSSGCSTWDPNFNPYLLNKTVYIVFDPKEHDSPSPQSLSPAHLVASQLSAQCIYESVLPSDVDDMIVIHSHAGEEVIDMIFEKRRRIA